LTDATLFLQTNNTNSIKITVPIQYRRETVAV